MVKRFLIGFVGVLLLSIDGWGCAPAPAQNTVAATSFWTEDSVMRDVLSRAVARVATATGRSDVRVAPDGVPVTFLDDVWDLDVQTCASTYERGTGEPHHIEVDRTPMQGRCMPIEATIVHEVMHALAVFESGVNEHSATGIFAPEATPMWQIDDESLSRLCEAFECAAFEPETETGSVSR